MTDSNSPTPGNGTSDLAKEIAKLRDLLDRRAEAQESISRNMVATAKPMGQATENLASMLGEGKQLLELLVSLLAIVVILLLIGLLVDGTRLLLVSIVLVLAGIYFFWLRRHSDRKSKLITGTAVVSAIAAVLACVIAMADLLGFRPLTDVDEIRVGFGALGDERSGEVGEPSPYPLILVGPFAPGKDDTLDLHASLDEGDRKCAPFVEKRELKAQVCAARTALAGASLAIVIGRHDRQKLRAGAEARLYSNAAIAERRAGTVARMLNDPTECTPPAKQPPVVVTLSATPRVVMGKGMACDRMVEIVGLRGVMGH